MSEISIITPSLGADPVLAGCVQSVANQTRRAEHLVVSGDAEEKVAAVLAGLESGVCILSRPPRGIYAAINSGIRAAGGDVVGVLHADDFYPGNDILERVADVFSDPAVGACYGDLCYVDAEDTGRIVRYWRAGPFRPRRFRQGWMPPHPTFFLRKGLYEQHGLYREDLGTAADYELMLRMLYRHRVEAAYLPVVMVHMRTGGASNASLGARLAASQMDRQAWRVNGLRPYPWTLLAKPARKVSQWWRRPEAE